MVKKKNNQKQRKPIVQTIVFMIIIMALIMGHLHLYEKFVLGFDKDCKPYIGTVEHEEDLPAVCQDFSGYHLLLIGTIICLALAFMFMLNLVRMWDDYDKKEDGE